MPEEEEVVLCGTGTVEYKCMFFLYSLLMGSVDMQETKILFGELVMMRTTAEHATTNI